MQQNLLTKLSVLSADYKQEMLDTLGFSENKVAEAVSSLNTFYQFDDKVTAPLHGFKDAQTYYDQCSALPKLANISTPSLILHAADDPFMDENVIPNQQQLSSDVAYELSAHGGHVGFMQGSIFSPKLWLSERIVGHFNFIHEQQ
jgi:predicted alpha/beta-fold hydrolase